VAAAGEAGGEAPAPGAATDYGALLDQAPCPRHPGRALALACGRCRAPICAECGGDIAGARVCDACLSLAFREDQARKEAPEYVRQRSRSGGLIFVLGIMLVAGGIYVALRPSIERAKRRAGVRSGETALRKVFDAARLYAEDHRQALPVPSDRRIGTLAESLLDLGYLRVRPKGLPEGRVVTETAVLGQVPYGLYAVEEALHLSPEDDSEKRWLLRTDGQVHELSEADTQRAIAQGSVLGIVSGTAFPWQMRTPPASPATVTPAAAPAGASTSTSTSNGG